MSKNSVPLQPSLTFSGVERKVNIFIAFIFYYRLFIVLLSVIALGFIGKRVWFASVPGDQLKNLAYVLTCGSIIIAIFYSVLNYEYTQIRFKHDKQNSKDILTFQIACKTHESEMIDHFKALKLFYNANKSLITQHKLDDFHKKMEEDIPVRTSFIMIFNYLECIALGVQQGIIDEVFIMDFFKTIFRDYSKYYCTYIDFARKEFDSPRIYVNFTDLATKWNS